MIRLKSDNIYKCNNTHSTFLNTFAYPVAPWSSKQRVGLLDVKPGFEPQARHKKKTQKVFPAKTLRVN